MDALFDKKNEAIPMEREGGANFNEDILIEVNMLFAGGVEQRHFIFDVDYCE